MQSAAPTVAAGRQLGLGDGRREQLEGKFRRFVSKMAALFAIATEPAPDFPLVRLSSEGVILIYGRNERAIEAGNLLADQLDVTVLGSQPS